MLAVMMSGGLVIEKVIHVKTHYEGNEPCMQR